MSDESGLSSKDLGRKVSLMHRSPGERCGVNLGDNYSDKLIKYQRGTEIGGYRELIVKENGLIELYVETPYSDIFGEDLEGKETAYAGNIDALDENFDVEALEDDYETLDGVIRELEPSVVDLR